MRSKKLIVSIATLGSGGAERVLSLLSSAFADNFCEVEFILWKHAPIFYNIDSRINIIDIEQTIGSKNEFKKIFWFRNHVLGSKDAAVLSFLYPYNIRALLALFMVKTPIMVAERRDGSMIRGGRFGSLLRDLLYKGSKLVFLQTESNRKNYHDWLFNKIEVIPNPINFTQDKVGVALLSPKINKIVSVGRLIAIKNQRLLISSFKEFYRSHPDYSLVIYGEGEMRQELQSYINSQGLHSAVTLAGVQNNIHDLIKDAKVFVLTSDSEGMPNALIEAMALGLPCISTKVNGAIDLVRNEENGILVSTGNQKAISDAICRIVENDDFAYSLGAEASKIYDMLNLRSVSQQWIDKLTQTMRGGKRLIPNKLATGCFSGLRIPNCRLAA